MTYKHINFDDSPIMRSLEKHYIDNNLFKNNDSKKEAKNISVPNILPSVNLDENILKLAQDLRAANQSSYAAELESNFLIYKQVLSLYQTSNETGEDLIQSAHPNGSHKMEDLNSSEAVFEDVLDRHLKILDMVSKNPKGKLSNANQIIEAVKVIFAGEFSDMANINKNPIEKLYSQALEQFNQFDSLVEDFEDKAGTLFNLKAGGHPFDRTYELINLWLTNHKLVNRYDQVVKTIDNIINLMRSKSNPKSENNWLIGINEEQEIYLVAIAKKAIPLAEELKKTLSDLHSLEIANLKSQTNTKYKNENQPSNNITAATSDIVKLNKEFSQIVQTVDQYKTKAPQAKKWLDSVEKEVGDMKDSFDNLSEEDKEKSAATYLQNLNSKIKVPLQAFKEKILPNG